jgi:UDP-N-acetylmuramyl pentapeptide phosphotransferase/UDP-N-acetylglucosamine-1-phosphate transferase
MKLFSNLEMVTTILIYIFLSMALALSISPFIIKTLKSYGIIRKASRNIQYNDTKNGKPIMGGLIFIIPIIILGIIANYNIASSVAVNNSNTIFSGSIEILLLTFAISAILGALDDILNIYGTERPVRNIGRVIRLIFVHKSTAKRIKLAILLPWDIYKNFFFMMGSNPGKGIQAHEKIIVQVFIGIILCWWIYFHLNINTIWIPGIGDIFVGIFMIPIIIGTLILTSNAVNISDGMDGLSSGMSIISLCGFLIAATLGVKNEPIAIICAISIGSLLVYFFFNTKPAILEMGDTGSLALGTLLASIAFAINRPILLIPFCGIFYLELFSSIIQGLGRRILGRRIFRMAPLHHHFEMMDIPEEKIVFGFWIASMILFLIGMNLII